MSDILAINNNYNNNYNYNVNNTNNQIKQQKSTEPESSQLDKTTSKVDVENTSSNSISTSNNIAKNSDIIATKTAEISSGIDSVSANKLPELILQLLPPVESVENVESENNNIVINAPNLTNSANNNNTNTDPLNLGNNVNTQS